MMQSSLSDANVGAGNGLGTIALIGPGGAGKTTVGSLLGRRLGVPFIDLDQRFAEQVGDISECISRVGYRRYGRANVDTCHTLIHETPGSYVFALSSGFMTYQRDVHPEYVRLRRRIEHSSTTFVLLPSLDLKSCVAETVRRQLMRPFARSADAEAEVIRERFGIYVNLRPRKVQTMRHPLSVVEELFTLASLWRECHDQVLEPIGPGGHR
jgi:shikimate kinase